MNFGIFFHANSHKFYFWFFILLLGAQIFLWKKTENYHPPFEIIPPAPNKYLVEGASFGDHEFVFRSLAMRLQNSGDVFAGFIALKNYDYARIYDWMKMLDGLNSESHLVPALASDYYSQTTETADVIYIVNYLDEHAQKNIDENWWWMFQASFLAKEVLKDMPRALDLAGKLAKNNSKKAPLWTKQWVAFLSEKNGDGCLAFRVIAQLIDESESGKRVVQPQEMEFMRYFIKSRLSQLKNKKFDPRKC